MNASASCSMLEYTHSLLTLVFPLESNTQTIMLILKLFLKIRPMIVVVLFIVFLLVFGLPSYKKLIKEDVLIKETKLKSHPINSPAITICVNPVRMKTISLTDTVASNNCLIFSFLGAFPQSNSKAN